MQVSPVEGAPRPGCNAVQGVSGHSVRQDLHWRDTQPQPRAPGACNLENRWALLGLPAGASGFWQPAISLVSQWQRSSLQPQRQPYIFADPVKGT